MVEEKSQKILKDENFSEIVEEIVEVNFKNDEFLVENLEILEKVDQELLDYPEFVSYYSREIFENEMKCEVIKDNLILMNLSLK